MEIIPLGHSAFKLKGKSTSVVTDPYDSVMVGLRFPKHTSAAIVTVSHQHPDHNRVNVVEPEGEQIVFCGPGEYEARGVEITGIATFHDNKGGAERGGNTMYKIEIDRVSILHCGDLGHKLTEEQEDLLGDVDVLLIPVGGFYTIDGSTAATVVTQLEPKIVVPMHYQRPELNLRAFADLAPVGVFLKQMGRENIVPQPRLKVTKDTLPQEMQIVVLE